MSWTSPRSWVVGEVVTATLLNTHVRDNLNAVRQTVGTALPTSGLVTGDVYTLTDSTTAPTWAWSVVYNSAITDAYKWLVVGGAPLVFEQAAYNSSETSYTTKKTYSSMPAGVYAAEIQVEGGGAAEKWYASIGWGTTTVDADAAITNGASASSVGESSFRAYQKTMAASGSITLDRKKTDGTFERVGGSTWRIMPLRLST